MNILPDLLIWPIPPFYLQKFLNRFLIKTIPDDLGRIASDDGVRGNIFNHYGTGADGRPITNRDTREDGDTKTDPDIIANDDIPLRGGVTRDRSRLLPAKGEGICADPIDAVFTPEKNGDIPPNGTVSTNLQ